MKRLKTKKFVFLLILPILVLLSFISFQGFFLYRNSAKATSSKKLYIGKIPFTIEVADTKELQTKGLSGRKKLGSNSGMLFVFPKPSFYYFWMKDMNFPLDFIWINENEVVDVSKNVTIPAYNTQDYELPRFTSKKEADKILEINSGEVEKYNIKIGDKVFLEK